ncbi:MAG: xanthine dehydrogenase family protein molybdopterin-binding subunit [Planctomycetes bacterium]|nr:xanthine dehydrogenase family protein molybdopterin-binding subunit [Planctomycetota bacterium]
MTTPRQEIELAVGFGKHIEKRKVDVPDGDAPPWDANSKFTVVGTDADRVDGLAKASGRAKYTYDINFPGMLYGVIVRATIAKGKLDVLEVDEARKMPGIAAVVLLKEVGNKVRFVGDPLCAIAGTNLDVIRDAMEKVRAQYTTEEHNVDFLQNPEAPVLDGDGNLIDAWPEHEIGGVIAGAEASHEGTYRTEVQTHSSLETHGAVARWQGDDLEIWMSTQATFGVRGELARALDEKGHKPASVSLHAEFVGGGFGSKFSAGVEGLAVCLLAREAKAPVKLMLDRFEEHTCTGNRPSSLMQIRAAAKKDGTLVAWDTRSFGGVGFAPGGGGVTFPQHYIAEVQKRGAHKDLVCDTDPPRPMRAPTWPQGYFGGELFLDELAGKIGIDPLEFRLKNDGQVIRQEQWRMGAGKFGWLQARNPKPGSPRDGDDPRYLRGAGLASARWGGMGNHGGRTPHGCTCRIHADGKVETRSGAQDIGTGLKTAMAMLTAEELGLAAGAISVFVGHTADPSGPAAGGSTTTPSLAPVIRHAAWLARQELAKIVAQHLGCKPEEVTFAGGKVGAEAAAKPMLSWADACKLIGPNPIETRGTRFPNYKGEAFNNGVCGCQFAEVRIDTWTGQVKVLRMLAIQDCGIVIAKKLAESQVLGAMIQGISYALHEQRLMDKRSGRMLNGDFLRYKITGPADMPPMECIMMSVANGHTNTSSVGLGEPPSVAAPAAIANAVYNAIGVPVRHLPITPDKVLQALAARRA